MKEESQLECGKRMQRVKEVDAGRRLAEASSGGSSPTQRNGTTDARYNRWETSDVFLGAAVMTSIKCALASLGKQDTVPPVGSNHPDICEHGDCTAVRRKTRRARRVGAGSIPCSVLLSVQTIRTKGVDGFCAQQVLKIA